MNIFGKAALFAAGAAALVANPALADEDAAEACAQELTATTERMAKMTMAARTADSLSCGLGVVREPASLCILGCSFLRIACEGKRRSHRMSQGAGRSACVT